MRFPYEEATLSVAPPSHDPSFTTIISTGEYVCASALSIECDKKSAPLYTGMMIDTLGFDSNYFTHIFKRKLKARRFILKPIGLAFIRPDIWCRSAEAASVG
jgi:hypothetical protein